LSTPPPPRSHGIMAPFQEEALSTVFRMPESEPFAIGGGSALSEYYLGHRLSEDLDILSFEADAVPLLGERLMRDLPAALEGASVSRYRRYPTFQGFLVARAVAASRWTSASPPLRGLETSDGLIGLGTVKR
jgi:hypothetical protein